MATYYIRFDTKEMEGVLVAWRVDVSKEVIRDRNKPLAINLCEDPLYPALVHYVQNNPVRKVE
jgi:hypothetical protein